MCKTTEYIDTIYRYAVIALLWGILYVLMSLSHSFVQNHTAEKQPAHQTTYLFTTWPTTEELQQAIQKEFEYDRKNFKFIIEE